MDIAIILIAGIISALVTFYLNNQLQLGGVMASAGISVLAGGLFFIFPDILNNYLTTNIPVVVMGASFIGMAASRIIRQFWIIGLSGFIFSVIFLLTGSYFEGFGGSLGTTAAISLGAVCALKQIKKSL
ncbi:hypothetical protein [Christiangramia forsetii]|uniref:Uncharacterized protein n=2 Tax=Christiangramia forsetii TaxID=411153 RepID=A0M2R7_CHRFK|nr:hypothetical protein [Christiangramia forsetii]GGG44426.1 hypothetical protein GCM10011532_30510 [Christiangramia forsetii]CAL66912.1 conserved hypothetical protein, membrane [Christiangramia forsetii KT0803]